MVLVKVLKRRDASSVVVAVVVAMILYQMIQIIPTHWASWLSGLGNSNGVYSSTNGLDWKGQYIYPLVLAILELIVLEVLGWVYVWFKGGMRSK